MGQGHPSLAKLSLNPGDAGPIVHCLMSLPVTSQLRHSPGPRPYLPTIQEQFGDEQCLFQHDGAPCHEAKVITKWLGEQNINILGPWPGNSTDLNPIVNLWSILKRRVDKQNPTNSVKFQALIMQEWAAISQDVAQKLIDSMPGRIAEVLKKKGQHCKY